jgi:hypothetical protein
MDSIEIPPSDSLVYDFGKIVVQASNSESGIQINLEKDCFGYVILPDQFEEFERFCDQIRKVSDQYIKIYQSL